MISTYNPSCDGQSYSWPVLIKFLIEAARLVLAALPPKQSVNAVNTALFPLPLCPMTKFMKGPKGTVKFSWHYTHASARNRPIMRNDVYHEILTRDAHSNSALCCYLHIISRFSSRNLTAGCLHFSLVPAAVASPTTGFVCRLGDLRSYDHHSTSQVYAQERHLCEYA